MDIKLTFFVILALLGLFLLGKGITGFTIMSQTCCFPSEDCELENTCDVVNKTELETNVSAGLVGLLLVASSFLLIHKYINKKE